MINNPAHGNQKEKKYEPNKNESKDDENKCKPRRTTVQIQAYPEPLHNWWRIGVIAFVCSALPQLFQVSDLLRPAQNVLNLCHNLEQKQSTHATDSNQLTQQK